MSTYDFAAVVVAVIALLFAGLSWRNSKQTSLHNLIGELSKDYLSVKMHHAIKTLWQFYRECNEKGTDFVEKYERRRLEDEKWVSSLDRLQRIEGEEDTLHYQRRLVSHFYQYMAALYVMKILPKGIVFKTWPEEDLKIIPEIIVPIENKLRQVLNVPPLPSLDDSYGPLVLYQDSKRHILTPSPKS